MEKSTFTKNSCGTRNFNSPTEKHFPSKINPATKEGILVSQQNSLSTEHAHKNNFRFPLLHFSLGTFSTPNN